MYVLPQEVEVWYIIPALRRDISKRLSSEYGVSYEKIGKLLGVTKAAVSQYINNKRADKIKLHEKINLEVEKSCKRIFDSKSDALTEIQRILKLIHQKDLHCEVCGGKVNGVHEDCKQVVARYGELE